MEKNPILIVDDEISYLELMKEFLNQEGYTNIITESNPLNVLPLLDRTDIDLILLDIFMPEMDGVEVCRSIRSEPELSEMKVIITTGYPHNPKLDEVVRLGFTNIFSKPFNLLNFVRDVDKILGREV